MPHPFHPGLLLGLAILLPVTAKPPVLPVPPEVWNLTAADSQGTGAIILERRLTFDDFSFELFYRIRILSEAGKAAVSVLRVPEAREDLWGRTHTRTGEVYDFDPKKDVLSGNRMEGRGIVVVPPGLSPDCVVDFHWRVPQMGFNGFAQTSMDRGTVAIPLALDYPIALEVLTIPAVLNFAWTLKGGEAKPEVEGTRIKQVTYRNLEALSKVPFTLEPARDLPRLNLYYIPNGLRHEADRGAEGFWEAMGPQHFSQLLEGLSKGSVYREWSEAMRKGLPEAPQAAAYELALRLDAGIRNTSRPTFQEAGAQIKYPFDRWDKARDLGEAVKRGQTNDWGMLLLYVQLLRDAKLPVRLLLVADRNVRFVDPRLTNLYQFTHALVGVAEAGKPELWVDPALRHAMPGVLDAAFQGTLALAYDVATWKPEFLRVPVAAARANVARYACRLELGEEEDRFKVEAAFSGWPEHQERRRYMALEPSAQAKILKETLEATDLSLRIVRAEMAHTEEVRENVTWSAEGIRQHEPGRRLSVAPFPGVPWPLRVPEAWAVERTEPIVMPQVGTLVATATFRIPEGWRLMPAEAVERKNCFGKVVWTQEQLGGGEGRILLGVEVSQLSAGPDRYAELQAFTAWVREAMTRTVGLEKP